MVHGSQRKLRVRQDMRVSRTCARVSKTYKQWRKHFLIWFLDVRHLEHGSDRLSEDMPEYMPDRVPEDMPDSMPGGMPEDMPGRMPEDMPDRMPEDMSDRMPEDHY